MGRISGKVFNWPGLDYELITAPNAVQGVQRAVFGSLGQEPVCVSRGCDWQPGLRLPLKLMGGGGGGGNSGQFSQRNWVCLQKKRADKNPQ